MHSFQLINYVKRNVKRLTQMNHCANDKTLLGPVTGNFFTSATLTGANVGVLRPGVVHLDRLEELS